MRRLSALLACLLFAVAVPGGQAAVVPELSIGYAWSPTPLSKPLYGTQPPSEDPETQQHFVEAADGVQLFVETWLPAEGDGGTPPAKVPTILVMTPYVSEGVEEYPPNDANGIPGFIDYMTSRGYAVAQHHVRGTGESGGCLEQTAEKQIDDGARVVEYLGRDAPWTDGNVGMYGVSYDAETQISVAGGGDPEMTKYLKAIVPLASVGGQYEYSNFDGVPFTGYAATSNAGYLAAVSAIPGQRPAPQHYVEKLTCQPEVLAGSGDVSGDMTPFWKAREYRPLVENVKAATLYVHGLRDFNVQPMTIAGWFDRLPESTPHKGLFGVFNHAFPYRHTAVEPDWARPDWLPMATAWFDRWLKGLDTNVEEWPEVQVQASDGQWREEPEFPSTGGPVGQLALGPSGAMGVTSPEGETSYTEGTEEDDGRAVFETEPVRAPLHLAGQPVLDLWLTTDRPDGHIAARVEVIGPDGEVLRHDGTSEEEVATYGFRSLRHLDPMPDNYFVQEQGKEPAVGEALNVEVRFLPTDLVVPAGGRLRVTVAGTITYAARDSLPSGMSSTITLRHDCDYPSALRFVMPTPGARLLDVREDDEPGALGRKPAAYGLRDGGGMATAAVCGKAPKRLGPFGAARPAVSAPDPGPAPGPAPAPEPAPRPAPKPAPSLPATGAEAPLLALVLLAAATALRAHR